MTNTSPPDWKQADAQLIKEILRQAEARLSAQMSMAMAADQRAAVLAGIWVAAATGIIAAILTLQPSSRSLPLLVGASCAVGLFLLGAFYCIWATMPVQFYAPGNEPSSWYKDIAAKRDEKESLGEQAEHYDSMIKDNRTVMTNNGNRLSAGALLGLAAPLFALIVGWLTSFASGPVAVG